MTQNKLTWDYWSDDLTMGIPMIDADHRAILDLIGQLRQAYDQPEADAAARIALYRIARYADQHFTREESMLAQANYPYLPQHKQRHDTFRAYVATVNDTSDHLPEVGELLSWLVDWWVGHIVTEDKMYRDHMLAADTGSP